MSTTTTTTNTPKLLGWYPSNVGEKLDLFQGMITVEIMPNYAHHHLPPLVVQTWTGPNGTNIATTKTIPRNSAWELIIGQRYWSRDKNVFWPHTQEGLLAAKNRAITILEFMGDQIEGELKKLLSSSK